MKPLLCPLIALVLGCGTGGGTSDGGVDGASDGGVNDVAADTYVDQHPPYDVHAADRTACKFMPGDLTTTTIGPTVPHGDALPFKHIVFLMHENRSFDHYFSKLPSQGLTDVDVAQDTDSNPEPGPPLSLITRFKETRYCIVDLDHEWGPVHLQYDNGAMDGFVITNDPGGARTMGYYDQTDFGWYYWLSKTFSISDRHFSSLLGPTWPNRFFFYGATSWGRTMTPDVPPLNKTKILNLMDTASRTWKIYYDGSTSFGVVFGPQYAGSAMSQFDADVAANALPDLAIIDPSFSGSNENDEHPPTNVQLGQQFTARVLNALMGNPAVWQETVFIHTYDEHGGYWDHVAPPPACIPDNNTVPDYAFDRYGIRVPLQIVSPWSKAGYVSHLVTDHTSITRFIENRFDLPAMTARDANAWPLLDMFDFANPPFLTPPVGAPSAIASQAGIDWCAQNPPGTGMP